MTRNPYKKRAWITWAAAIAISWPVALLTGNWLALLGLLPWLAAEAMSIRWLITHRTRKADRMWSS